MNKGINIQANKLPVFWLMLLLIFAAGPVSGQMTVSIGGQTGCENTAVFIPVDVSNFNDVAAFTFFIEIDTLKTEFVSIENPNVLLSGGVVISNFVGTNQQIIVSWASMSAANISNGKLFDIKVNYHEGYAGLVFTDQCEIALSNLTVVEDASYQNGLLIPAIQITGQPQAVSVTEGQQAQFGVDLQNYNGMVFYWQMFDGASWSDLDGVAPFSGVNTNQLTIDNVPLSLNNAAFRCRAQFEDDCIVISDSARLTVSPLTVISTKSNNESSLSVFPNPCSDKLNYVFDDSERDSRIQLISLLGEVVYDDQPQSFSGSMMLGNFNPGIYFFQVTNNNLTRKTVKVLKR